MPFDQFPTAPPPTAARTAFADLDRAVHGLLAEWSGARQPPPAMEAALCDAPGTFVHAP